MSKENNILNCANFFSDTPELDEALERIRSMEICCEGHDPDDFTCDDDDSSEFEEDLLEYSISNHIRTPYTLPVCETNYGGNTNELVYIAHEDTPSKSVKIYKIYDRIVAKHIFCVCNEKIYFYQGAYYRMLSDSELNCLISECLSSSEETTMNSYKAKEVKYMILRAKKFQHHFNEFNSITSLINCKNGIVNINSDDNVELLEHNHEYLFSYFINANFIADDEIFCPNFEKFCDTSLEGNPSKQKLLLEIIGYCCCDINNAKKAFFLKGSPDSGKSVMLQFIEKLVGEDVVSNIPIHDLDGKFNKADIYGKKLNIQAEMKSSNLPDISAIKAITGRDKLFAEFKGKNPFSFTPQCKLLFAGNFLPGTSDTEATKAFTNRIVLLLFNASIPKDQQDLNLFEKLWGERDSIFTLAIKELINLKKRHLEFTKTADSEKFLTLYAESSNTVILFIGDCCNICETNYVPAVDLYNAYITYCQENCFDIQSKSTFSDIVRERYNLAKSRQRKDNKNRYYYNGIALKEDF